MTPSRPVAVLWGVALAGLLLVAAWLLVAYLVAPEYWRLREARAGLPDALVTTTAQGIPGDPLNLGLLAAAEDVHRAFAAAGWSPADPVTARSAVGIGLSVALGRADPDAPVSALFYDGRRQDLAFEKAAGRSADRRHHVRLWQVEPGGAEDGAAEGEEPSWLGAASFDRGVGLSHDTGAVTHHIGPDLDAERDLVAADLAAAGWVRASLAVDGVAVTAGRNGGGDPYHTDGDLTLLALGAP